MITVDFWHLTGCVATLVIIPVLILMIWFINYLREVNYQLRDIRRILHAAFPAETAKAKQDYSGYSYLKKLLVWGWYGKPRDNDFKHNKKDDSDKVLHHEARIARANEIRSAR